MTELPTELRNLIGCNIATLRLEEVCNSYGFDFEELCNFLLENNGYIYGALVFF